MSYLLRSFTSFSSCSSATIRGITSIKKCNQICKRYVPVSAIRSFPVQVRFCSASISKGLRGTHRRENVRRNRKFLQDVHSQFDEDQFKDLLNPEEKVIEDLLLQKIKDCKAEHEVFYVYQQHSEVMSTSHLLAVLKQLHNLVKKDHLEGHHMHNIDDFRNICHHAYKLSRRMEVDDLVNVLKYLMILEVPSDSKVVQAILQMLKFQINEMDLKHMLFLEYLLKKLPVTPLSDALQTALPVVIENLLKNSNLKTLSVTDLGYLLTMCVRGKVRQTNVVVKEIYSREITNPTLALSIVWNLLHMDHKPDNMAREVLVKECLSKIARDMTSLTHRQVEQLLSRICQAYETHDFCAYYEPFLDAVCSHAISEGLNFEDVSHIITKFRRMSFYSEQLTCYMLKVVMQHPEDIPQARVKMDSLLSFASALQVQPDYMTSALDILVKNKALNLNRDDYYKIPLINLAVLLLCMDYHYPPVIEKLTNAESLSVITAKYSESNTLYWKLLLVDEALKAGGSAVRVPPQFLEPGRRMIETKTPSKSPLKHILLQILKPENVVSGVITDNSIYIDHLLVLDPLGHPSMLQPEESEDPSSTVTVSIASCNVPEGYKRIAVMDINSSLIYKPGGHTYGYVKLRKKILESCGFIVLNVLASEIFRHQHEEKILYVKRELMCAGVVLQ